MLRNSPEHRTHIEDLDRASPTLRYTHFPRFSAFAHGSCCTALAALLLLHCSPALLLREPCSTDSLSLALSRGDHANDASAVRRRGESHPEAHAMASVFRRDTQAHPEATRGLRAFGRDAKVVLERIACGERAIAVCAKENGRPSMGVAGRGAPPFQFEVRFEIAQPRPGAICRTL